MPLNTIYRSTTGIMGRNIRYYIEIIPRSTTLYSTPNTIEFPLASLENDWEIESILNDEKIGLKRPDGYKINIDLEMLPEDLRDYLLDPFLGFDMASEFPYKASTRVDIPDFDLTNVWILKTDEGDPDALIDDFVILNTFGVKKNPSRVHKITKDGPIQKHELDIILHDLFRVITEAIHPIYLTWLGYNDVQNGTIASPKEVERVYDIVYGNNGAATDFYNTKVKTSTIPTTTTVDSITISIGEKVLYSNFVANSVDVYQLVDDIAPTYAKILSYNLGTIYEGDRFYVTHGTDATKLFKVNVSLADPYSGLGRIVELVEISNESSLTKVIAKVDGNYNSVKAYYIPVVTLHSYINTAFNYFYRRLMRVSQSDTSYKLQNYSITNFLSAYVFFKQSYDRKYTQGDEITSLNQLYFCAFIKRSGVIVGGYIAENDNGNGIYEYENVWDLLENVKGQALTVSYAHDDKEMIISFDSIRGSINSPSSVIIDYKELTFGEASSYEIEENTEAKRGVIVNINVPGDDKNEHKYIKAGSISDEELSIKSMFHNNPSVNLAVDGWIETKSYPELKSSFERIVYKQDSPEIPFDITKLVYFDTPTDIADSEMAIRPHSTCSTRINGELSDYFDIPFTNLPLIDKPWDALKLIFIDLQRFAGLPFATAKELTKYFSKQGRFLLSASVLSDTIYNVPVGQSITVDISDKLLNGDEPDVHFLWLLRRKTIKGNNQDAEIELIGIY